MPRTRNRMIATLEKLIRADVVRHFAALPDSEKTVRKVEAFAQDRLDFFVEGMKEKSPELKQDWQGNPFLAKAALHTETLNFEIQIVEKGRGKP